MSMVYSVPQARLTDLGQSLPAVSEPALPISECDADTELPTVASTLQLSVGTACFSTGGFLT